jgi:predicted dehydrogenase
LGIVGSNYGRAVQLPAFRLDKRCEVVALAGNDRARTTEAAREAGIARAFAGWKDMIESADVDAIAIATPPRLQPEIAIAALRQGKPVFIEKPMAADLAGASAMMKETGSLATMMDFNFTEVLAWTKAKAVLEEGAVGRLRHVAVNWFVENVSTRLRLKNWKSDGDNGGGALGNFGSHALHYLEWFGGPIAALSANLSGLPDDPSFQTNIALSVTFRSGAAGSFAMSSASYLGSGHRLEFYGEDGTLVLSNTTTDYMRGFTLSYARRTDKVLQPVAIDEDGVDRQFPADGRIAPVSRLARRFLDAVEQRAAATPGFAEGYRVQCLLDAVRRSHALGHRVSIDTPEAA